MTLPKRTPALLLDLDGTLIDSLPGIEGSIREAVAAVLPGRSLPPVRDLLGPPIRDIFRGLIGPQPLDVEESLVLAFRTFYDREGCFCFELYPGVRETLAEIQRRKIPAFIVTNKPKIPTGKILATAGLTDLLTGVYCRDSRNPAFVSKSEMAVDLMERFSVDPASSCFVGDSQDDAEAAAACGMPFCPVSYGFGDAHRRGGHPVLHNFAEVLERFPL